MNHRFAHSFGVSEINETQNTLHHASQLIGIVGKQLITQEADDGNTNMDWIPVINTFAGHMLNNRVKVGLNVPEFSLKILDAANYDVRSFSLHGKTFEEAFSWLKLELIMHGVAADNLNPGLHYEIPPHATEDGVPFRKPSDASLTELSVHRTVFHTIISEFAYDHEHASEVKTWPHHFDHGVYIPFKFDENGDAIQSFSVGYAMDDTLVDEPYLYVTQWKREGNIDYSTAPTLEQGAWQPGGLSGAALRMSDIAKSADQEATIREFIDITTSWSQKA